MNTLLLRTLELKKTPSLQTFAQYKEAESQHSRHSSVTNEGELLEHQTLELRVHPPNVHVDNDTYDDRTIITVDSANRPGTLVEVVQCLTELGLNVKKARISSDGGWFVDEFHVTEAAGGPSPHSRKVVSEKKLRTIKAVLNVDYDPEQEQEGSQHGTAQHHSRPAASDAFDENKQHSTVFELSGQDRSGLLADVLQLLTHSGCTVTSAAVWTYSGRAAFVVSVVECNGQPIRDAGKLVRLKQLLHQMMDTGGNSIVTAQSVKGEIHFERRLHQLLLKEEEREWLRTKDTILARLQLKNDSCSCSCHQQGADGGSQEQQLGGSSGNGPTPSGTLTANGSSNSSGSLSQNGAQQHQQQLHQPPPPLQQQQQQQQPGAAALSAGGGSVGGACCCCQMEQAERHIVHSEVSPPPLLPGASTTPPPPHPHHTPSSSAGTLEELTESDRLLVSPKFSKPYVTIQHYCHLNYWLVTIRCKDRNKLFFDTVCTLSDLNYDVYHGAIDQEGDFAVQLYYIRPRFGDFFWDSVKATKLRVMLEAAIQRRFPKGLKVHVRHTPASTSQLGYNQNWLAELTAAWKEARLWITRAKVRAYTDHGHTLYVMDEQGQPPDPRKVQTACQAGGGLLQGPPEGLPLGVSPPNMGGIIGSNSGSAAAAAAAAAAGQGGDGVVPGQGAKFFYMLQKRAGWDGSPNSLTSM